MTLDQPDPARTLEQIIAEQAAKLSELTGRKEQLEADLKVAIHANDPKLVQSLQSLLNKLNGDIRHKKLEIDSMRNQRQLGLF